MVIYLDSSALSRLVIEQPESSALADWLDARGEEVLVTSVFSRVQVLRRCRELAPDLVPAALSLLAELALVPLSPEIVDAAWSLPHPCLDDESAIHLASALSLGSDLTALLSYREELRNCATQLTIESPGMRNSGQE